MNISSPIVCDCCLREIQSESFYIMDKGMQILGIICGNCVYPILRQLYIVAAHQLRQSLQRYQHGPSETVTGYRSDHAS